MDDDSGDIRTVENLEVSGQQLIAESVNRTPANQVLVDDADFMRPRAGQLAHEQVGVRLGMGAQLL